MIMLCERYQKMRMTQDDSAVVVFGSWIVWRKKLWGFLPLPSPAVEKVTSVLCVRVRMCHSSCTRSKGRKWDSLCILQAKLASCLLWLCVMPVWRIHPAEFQLIPEALRVCTIWEMAKLSEIQDRIYFNSTNPMQQYAILSTIMLLSATQHSSNTIRYGHPKDWPSCTPRKINSSCLESLSLHLMILSFQSFVMNLLCLQGCFHYKLCWW